MITHTGTLQTINGTAVKEPAAFGWTEYSINDADAGNSASGRMYTGQIGTKRTLELKWNAITPDQARTILAAVNGARYPVVNYFDPETGAYRSTTCYVGDRKVEYIQFWTGGERVNLSFQLIEREVS